jgi:hypothetical protein
MIGLWLVILLLLPGQSFAALYWEDGFENHLYPNWDGGGACITSGSPDGVLCPYPQISTAWAQAGTHSLFMHYPDYSTQPGTFMDRPHTDNTEVWTRFYVRHVNFVFPDGSLSQYSKLFYNKSASNGSWIIWEINDTGGELNAAINVTSPVNCPALGAIGGTTSDTTCVFGQNISSQPFVNNQTQCVETHVKANSGSGAQNGTLEIYVGGILAAQHTNIPLYMGTVENYNLITIYAQTGQGDRYYDNFAVGSTRFNDCAGGGGSAAGGGLDF